MTRRSTIWTRCSPGATRIRAPIPRSSASPASAAAGAWCGCTARTRRSSTPAMTQTPLDIVDPLNAPVLGLYGGADQGIPLEQVEKLREALKKSRSQKARQSQIHIYEGMPHGFNADYRPSYRKEAAADGWKRML